MGVRFVLEQSPRAIVTIRIDLEQWRQLKFAADLTGGQQHRDPSAGAVDEA